MYFSEPRTHAVPLFISSKILPLQMLYAEKVGGKVSSIMFDVSRMNAPSNIGGTQRQFSENICSEDDLRSRIFGTFVVKFFGCLPLLGFSNI